MKKEILAAIEQAVAVSRTGDRRTIAKAIADIAPLVEKLPDLPPNPAPGGVQLNAEAELETPLDTAAPVPGDAPANPFDRNA